MSSMAADRNQLSIVGGCAIGITVGLGVAQMLVALLTRVFDPAPEKLTTPWGYRIALVGAVAIAIGAALISAQRAAA